MVMHARKVARLDDGYRDLNQPEILPKDKGLSNSHSTKYTERKASKFDSFDHRRRSNSPRSFHSRSGHYDNKPRERHNYEDIDNRDSKTKEQKHKDHKSEVHRLAERVCGDWSEHISKSGKRYFYNCRTEVSQWEKPDCWIEENSTSTRNSDKVQHDASDRSKSSSSSKANSHGESRHSTGNNKTSSASKSTSRKDVRGTFREEQRSPPKNASSMPASKDVNSASFRASRQDRKRPYPRRSTSRSPAHSQKSGKFGSRGSSSELGSGGCYKNSSGGRNDPSAGNGGMVRKRDNGPIESAEFESSKMQLESKEAFDSHKTLQTDSPIHEDMDISPDNSFSQTEVETRTSHDGLNSKSSPQTSAVASTPIPSGINTVAGNNGETSAPQSEQPSLVSARVPPSSKQELSFSLTASAPGTASSNATSAWSGANVSNLQQQQSLQTTLAGLEQAVLRLNPDKMSASVSGQQNQSNSQANFASCLALLPVLLTQLSNQAGPGGNNSDNQLIIQQVIPLLKKLQEIVVHQQQQQQQMKLQQAIIQLLQMQNLGGSGVHANAGRKTPGNDKAESPYSPPDSDGSPVQTPSHNRHYPHHHHNRQSAQGNRQSPRQHQYHQESSHQVPVSKPNRQEKMVLHQTSVDESDERTDGVPFNAGLHSKTEKNHARPSVNSQPSTSSAGSQTPSHHPGVPFYRKNDVELTPSLMNHFDPNIIDHVTNWQADTLVKQADCIAADNYSYLGPLCSQVSVELKQARSMVRAQEILSTRNEQRRIFIQHQLYELDKDLPVPSFLPQNPIVVTFPQQHPSTHVPPAAQQQAAVPHPISGPVTQPNPVPTPLSPQVTPAQLPLPANPSSPVPPQDAPSTSQGTPVATVAPCESSGMDLT